MGGGKSDCITHYIGKAAKPVMKSESSCFIGYDIHNKKRQAERGKKSLKACSV